MKKEKTQKEEKRGISKRIFTDVVMAILVIAYIVGMYLIDRNVNTEIFDYFIKISTVVFVAIGIIILEIAYKKESKVTYLRGMEFLIIAAYIVSIKYVIQVFNFEFKIYTFSSIGAFSIYYLLKMIIIYTNSKRKDLENLSDISDIVADEKPLKKEASKRKVIKENIEIEKVDENNADEAAKTENEEKPITTNKKDTTAKTTRKKAATKEEKEEKSKVATKKTTTKKTTEKKVATKEKTEEKPKAATKKTTAKTTRKKVATKEETEEKPKVATKKTTAKTTTKRTSTSKKDKEETNKTVEDLKETEEVKHKRRGRPRKEVAKND